MAKKQHERQLMEFPPWIVILLMVIVFGLDLVVLQFRLFAVIIAIFIYPFLWEATAWVVRKADK